jgi:hypothetical protein
MADVPQRRPAFNWDLASSVALTLLGLAVCGAALTFPGTVRGVPGPAFFPITLGLLLIVLAIALVLTTRGGPPETYWTRPAGGGESKVLRQIGVITLLLVTYVSLWDVVPFIARTPPVLFAIYRTLGETWTRALLLSAVITLALFALFQGALSIQL